jgi:hypothetical protein
MAMGRYGSAAMARLALTRSPEDRKLYVLPGVGELRVARWPGKAVEATAGGRTYTFAPRGQEHRVPTATDAFGAEVGHQHGSWSLIWRSAKWDLDFMPDISGSYALRRRGEEREVAYLALTGWGKRPVPIVLDDDARLDPGLVLFAMYLMNRFAEEVNRSASYSAAGGGGGG